MMPFVIRVALGLVLVGMVALASTSRFDGRDRPESSLASYGVVALAGSVEPMGESGERSATMALERLRERIAG